MSSRAGRIQESELCAFCEYCNLGCTEIFYAEKQKQREPSRLEMSQVIFHAYDVTNSASEKTNNMILQINKIMRDGIGLGGIFHGAIEVLRLKPIGGVVYAADTLPYMAPCNWLKSRQRPKNLLHGAMCA
eukprot:Gb_14694 [translate_table: standard]